MERWDDTCSPAARARRWPADAIFRGEGATGSRTVCVNGAAARLVQVGDPIIVISYAQMTPDEAARHHPTIVLLNADNSIRETIAGDRTTPIEILSESL